MCGLVGVVGNDISYVSNKVFKQLLYIDALRGPHSTGIARNNAKNNVSVYKRALNSTDFLQLDTTKSFIGVDTDFLMGHNRYATQGEINDTNAHPFTYGNVTLCHNGTLTDQSTLPDYKNFEVDSENIAYAMGLAENPKDVVSKLVGAFALTWYNDYELKYYIVRNKERPMFIAKEKGKDLYYYASEEHMLHLVLSRNGIKYEINELPVGKLVSFDLSKSVTKLKFTDVKLAKPKPITYNTGTFINYGRNVGSYPSNTTYKKPNPLSHYKLKVGDEVEFYTSGLPDVLPSNITGVLRGISTCKKPMKIKCFNQPNDSLAGYYTAIVTSLINESGHDTLIVSEPWLAEVVIDDANNSHRTEVVNNLVAKDEVLASTQTQEVIKF